MQVDEATPPDVKVADIEGGETAPIKTIKGSDLQALGQQLSKTFDSYVADRFQAEQKWLRNLRQYLGIYDPDIEKALPKNKSRAYPKLTRVKCISVLSRVINLMFPGNDRNWTLQASPSPDMAPADVQQAIADMQKLDQAAGLQPQQPTQEMVDRAVKKLADTRAAKLMTTIDDQLSEIGGDQSLDYVHLNRKVVGSGIMYGLGVLRGPFVRVEKQTRWTIDAKGMPAVTTEEKYKPQYEHVPVWDFYPDMSAKTMQGMDGYFIRMVMSRSQVLALAKRPDFFASVIKDYLKGRTQGNYKAQTFETDLRSMGVKINVNDQKQESQKFELLVWNGPLSCETLISCGVDVPDDKRGEEVDAEVWMIDGRVIKAAMNPWAKIGVNIRTIHTFLFDEDDTSPVGNGLPNVMRDSAMGIAAATRMLMDNASITCGPNLEVNAERMLPQQDITQIEPYKIWYSEGTGADAQYPAVRNVQIDGHMDELMKIIELFMKFADVETFVGPATGGDMDAGPSEPFRTAAGASMLRGDAALPFKDIIRNFDTFTQSVITSLVFFNRKFNPDKAQEGDYNVIARGATSLIAKEVRGIQLDALAQTLTPDDRMDLDERKFLEARFKVRDMEDMLVSEDEAQRRRAQRDQAQQQQQQQQQEMVEANVKKLLSDAFKNIAQGQKNSAAADATQVNAAIALLEKGASDGQQPEA